MKRILSLLFLVIGTAYAQDTDGIENYYEGQVSKMVNIPNSPEAEAFAKYGDTDVSLHSGVPSIGVPLHTIPGREMDLPISLTYDASGVKVEQMATPVGLGWNLQVGGRISRVVNGLPDDFNDGQYATIYNAIAPTGGKTGISGGAAVKSKVLEYTQNQYLDNPRPIFSNTGAADNYFDFLYDVNNNFIDTQPDYFSLNAPGLSETVVIDYTDNYVAKALNNPRIEITPTISTDSNNEIIGWTVTSDNGTKYEFNEIEYTLRQHLNDNSFPQGDYNTTYGSSWLLTKITSPNGKDVYDFSYNYQDFWPQPESISSASVGITEIQSPPPNSYPIPPHAFKSGMVSSTEEQLLSTITLNGKVLVEMGFANRMDSQNSNNSRYASIDIYDFKGSADPNSEILKRIEFDNDDYFNLDGQDPSQKDYYEIRLKLNGLSIKGNEGTNTYQTYAFEYERPENVPRRNCTGQDYFGYYNGKDCEQSLYQAYPVDQPVFPGGNREPNSYHAKTGILTKITYPTKGYSVFNYEGHKDSNADIGGIRIASIIDYANTELPAQTKTYSYSDAGINYRPVISELVTNKPEGFESDSPFQPKLVRYASFPKGNEPYVTYYTVTEEKEDNNGQKIGATTYTFYNNGSKGVTPNNISPYENRFSGNLTKGNLAQRHITDNESNSLSKTTYEYYIKQEVIDVPGLVVYNNEFLQWEFIMYYEQADGSTRTERINGYPCNELSQGGGTSGEFSGTFWWCPCFTDLNNDPDCGYLIKDGVYNTFLVKKTQAFGQYGGINKTISEQTLVDANGTPQTVTTSQDIVFTSQDDGYGNLPFSDDLYLPRKIRTTDSKGDIYETTTYYPTDNVVTGSLTLDANNNLVEEVKVVMVKDPDSVNPPVISEQENEYGTTVTMMPTKVKTNKAGLISERAEFTYYSNGNLQTAKPSNGPTTVYLWGYDNRYPVAKVENTTVAAIQALSSFTSTLDLGDGGLSQTQEDDLRGLQGALVTTYDYKPLVGVKTITDYRGFKTEFEYDDFNRLQWVKDEQGNLLNDYDYGYATPIQN